MPNVLGKIQYWGLLLLIFLLPLFFLPLTSEFFDFNKMALLVLATVVLSIVWALRGVFTANLTIFTSHFDLPVFLVALVFILSTIVGTENKIDAFLFPGTTTLILVSTLLYFLITQTVKTTEIRVKTILNALLISGVLVSVVGVASSLGFLDKVPGVPGFFRQNSFSLVGSPLSTFTFLIVLTALGVGFIAQARRAKLVVAFYSLIIGVFLAGLVATSAQMLPGRASAPKILPISTAWVIAVETLKTSPLGFGPGNFVAAFNLHRPLTYNATSFWDTRFGNSSNWYLALFSEVGIVGFIAFLFLAWRAMSFSYHNPSLKLAVFSSLFLFLVFPVSLLVLVFYYVLLSLAGTVWGKEINLSVSGFGKVNKVLPILVLLLVLGIATPILFLGERAYSAEVFYKNALEAAARNDGEGLFKSLAQAIEKNPRVERYRIVFSQANLGVAGELAKKPEVTPEDRDKITKRVQLAINQAQVAVAINKKLSTNWENLARVYRSVIPIARGADDWALVTYTQAIALEPTNPILRINLGGVHFAAGRYDDAARAFEQAVQAKQDLPNARYNLSLALREKGDVEGAIREMEKTIELVEAGSEDYKIASLALEELKNRAASSGTGGQGATPSTPFGRSGQAETLVAPSPSLTPLRPPLTLPQEAGPPQPPPTPSPTN